MSADHPGPHLGQDAAALVDGQLTDADRERALSHLAGCVECRSEVDIQRRLKAQLRGLAAEDRAPAPSGELVARLLGLPAELARTFDEQTPVSTSAARTSVRRSGPARRRDARGPNLSTRPYRRAGRASRYLAGSVTAVAAGFVLILAIGSDGPAAGVPVRPPVTGFVQQHAVTKVELPFSDPADAAVTEVFSP